MNHRPAMPDVNFRAVDIRLSATLHAPMVVPKLATVRPQNWSVLRRNQDCPPGVKYGMMNPRPVKAIVTRQPCMTAVSRSRTLSAHP